MERERKARDKGVEAKQNRKEKRGRGGGGETKRRKDAKEEKQEGIKV
jgi:hypothetical protein